MFTKEDFKQAIEQSMLKRDLTAALYHAGDPRIFQIIDAEAQMLAMLSQQIEVAMQEPFVKSRDATVLADAALKGLIFTAKPATVRIKAINTGGNAVKIGVGRNIIDSSGRYYRVIEPVTIAANSEGNIMVIQVQTITQRHTVESPYPFYQVNIEPPTDGSYISSITVKVNGEIFSPSYKFNGVMPHDKVFHVDSDEYRRLSIKFGEYSVIGVQPAPNDVIEIEKQVCFGNINPELGSPFALQQILQQEEQDLKLEMQALVIVGVDPVDMATLRELCRYPAIYDDNAVFLGEFDMLLRRHFYNLAFLSVWNEAKEEQVRGANIQNVNTLFIAFALPPNTTETKSAVQAQMRKIIQGADNSYKLKFVEPVISKIQCRISATISSIYDSNQVEAQIRDLLLTQYGAGSFTRRQGKVIVKHKDISELLIKNVQAINDQRSDLSVSVNTSNVNLPETYRYMDNQSIHIDLIKDTYESTVWGGYAN